MEPERALKRKCGSHMSSQLSIDFGNSGNSQSNTSQTQQGASLFGASTSQPQQTSSLFGATTNQQPAGGLFGGGNTSQPQQSGSLFGGATAQPQQTGSMFGASTQANPPQQSGGMFGSTAITNNQQQQTGGGLFGASTANAGGLFGSNNQQSQPQQSGGLFGGTLGQNQNQTQNQGQQQQGSSLFGNLGQQQNQPQQNQGNSLFGTQNLNQNHTQGQTGGMFGNLGNQNRPATSSMFGGGSTNQQPQTNTQPSLFGASVFNNNANSTSVPLAGSLTMGQSQAASQATIPGTRIDLSNIRPTTRFNDLHDDLKKTIESIDGFIKQQESYAAQCEALIPTHSANVESVTPDVDLIASKAETVELSLENDSRSISGAKELFKADLQDFTRCARVMENLQLPSQFHFGPSVGGGGGGRNRVSGGGGDEDYDVDLVGYFARQADAMQKTLLTFTSNLSEIESHLRVIEASTIQQSQQVATQRAGGGMGNDTVRELADTLRGFENGILDAAGFVGACRDGVNELILGRSGGDGRPGLGAGYRRY